MNNKRLTVLLLTSVLGSAAVQGKGTSSKVYHVTKASHHAAPLKAKASSSTSKSANKGNVTKLHVHLIRPLATKKERK